MAEEAATSRSARNRHRVNLTVRMSYDEGTSWPVSRVIDPGIAGYSDMAVTPDGIIHVFYEGGSVSPDGKHDLNQHMSLVSFDLEWLTRGSDNLPDSEKPIKP
jgi:sialidase-1